VKLMKSVRDHESGAQQSNWKCMVHKCKMGL
jgi:hypothetical protein